MTARTTRRRDEPQRFARFLVAVALVAVTSACTSTSDGAFSPAPTSTSSSASGPLVLDIDLLDARSWSASGPLVESGVVCARAMRHPLDFFDPGTGEPLTAVERRARVDEAWRDRKEADIIDVWENTCHDGSGSITTEEARAQRTWTVLSGTGAYIGMSGSGTLSVQRSPSGAAESMYVVAEVDL